MTFRIGNNPCPPSSSELSIDEKNILKIFLNDIEIWPPQGSAYPDSIAFNSSGGQIEVETGCNDVYSDQISVTGDSGFSAEWNQNKSGIIISAEQNLGFTDKNATITFTCGCNSIVDIFVMQYSDQPSYSASMSPSIERCIVTGFLGEQVNVYGMTYTSHSDQTSFEIKTFCIDELGTECITFSYGQWDVPSGIPVICGPASSMSMSQSVSQSFSGCSITWDGVHASPSTVCFENLPAQFQNRQWQSLHDYTNNIDYPYQWVFHYSNGTHVWAYLSSNKLWLDHNGYVASDRVSCGECPSSSPSISSSLSISASSIDDCFATGIDGSQVCYNGNTYTCHGDQSSYEVKQYDNILANPTSIFNSYGIWDVHPVLCGACYGSSASISACIPDGQGNPSAVTWQSTVYAWRPSCGAYCYGDGTGPDGVWFEYDTVSQIWKDKFGQPMTGVECGGTP